MKLDSNRSKGVSALILLAFVFACMGIFARFLNLGFSLFQQVYLRVLAAFFLGFIIFGKKIGFAKLKKIPANEWFLLIFRSVIFYPVGVVFFTAAVIESKLSSVSFIHTLPIVAILGILLLKEKINTEKFLLVATSFLGVALIVVKDYHVFLQIGKGEIYALFATLAFGFSYVSRRWHSALLNNQEITQLMFLIAAPVLFAISLTIGEGIPTTWNGNLIFVILIAGLFNVLVIYLSNYGFQKIEAVFANNILTLEALFAIFLGFIFYGEVPIARELIGGFLIIASAIRMNSLYKNKQ